MLLARSAGARIITANLCGRSHVRLTRLLMVMMIMPVVAIGAVHMAVICVLVRNGIGLRLWYFALVHGDLGVEALRSIALEMAKGS